MMDEIEVWNDPDKPRSRVRIVSVAHHGRTASTVVKRKADVTPAADRMLVALRAQCNTIGPEGSTINVSYDGPMCPGHAGHDQDCHETECPTCREVTPAPDAHRCVIAYPPDSCLQEDK